MLVLKALVLDFDSTISTPTFLTRVDSWAVADNQPLFASMSNEEILANFGGPRRIAKLAALLEALQAAGVRLHIISIGFRAAFVPHLQKVGLLRFFKVADIYGQDSPELRGVSFVKGKLIATLMASAESGAWCFDDVLFVDDSQEHIDKAARVCKTLLVPGGGGMTDTEFEAIRSLAELPGEGCNSGLAANKAMG